MAVDKKTYRLYFEGKDVRRLEVLAQAFNKNSVTEFLRYYVKTGLDNSSPLPLGANTAVAESNSKATSTDDKLDEPIIVTSNGSNGNRRPYVIRDGYAYPVHRGKSGTRMCLVDDKVVRHEVASADPDQWRDVTHELSDFENQLLDAWVYGFDWMYANYLVMFRTVSRPTIKDYERLLKNYLMVKE